VKKIISLVVFGTFFSCVNYECNCTDFKTGTFEFTKEINGKKQTSRFTRTQNLQIETFEGKTDTASVRWINDCEFILNNRHPKNREEKKAISIRIISTEKNTYTFEYGYVGDEKKEIGIVTKID